MRVCVMMMMRMYTHEMARGALRICGRSALASAFVQCWRVYVHEPVFFSVILFPVALVTVLSVSDP